MLDASGKRVTDGTDGAIVVKLPMPPGSLPTLWNDDERFVSSYMAAFDGYYLTGDGGRIDDDGYVFVMGRTDDVINVAGHRLSTGGMEEVLASHPDVAECAVIGVADPMKGQVPRGFVVLKAGVSRDEDELRAELVQLVRSRIGAVARSRTSRSSPRCRRPGRARSCARPCAASPTAPTSRCRAPSRTRRARRAAPGPAQALTRVSVPMTASRRLCGERPNTAVIRPTHRHAGAGPFGPTWA